MKTIIFDFDGVILDSLNAKTDAFYQMYVPFGIEIAEKVKKYHLLNGGVSRYEKFKFWHKNYLNKDISKNEIDNLSDEFSELVVEKVINSKQVKGSIEFIKKYSKSLNFFIITGTPQKEIEFIVNQLKIENYFIEVLGSPKNKKEWCKYLLNKYKLNPDDTIFLGDSLSDYEAANFYNFNFALRETNYNKNLFKGYSDIRFKNFIILEKILRLKKPKILITTTSFQDFKGNHHDLLNDQNWEIDFLRGPLKEYDLVNIIADYDGVLCGDDEFTDKVIKKGVSGNLKILSKYGVGLDKIDLKSAKKNNIIVRNCPGINQSSVAEHIISLILTFEKNIHLQYNSVKKGSWKRLVGREVRGKTLGILGLGSIGKELAILSQSFGFNVLVNDIELQSKFLENNKQIKFSSLEDLFKTSDYISINVPLTNKTKNLVDSKLLNLIKNDSVLINTARGELVNKNDVINLLHKKKLRGYLCDVLDDEPIKPSEELLNAPNVIISPHVASRTKENIEKQGIASLNNLIEIINKN